MTAGLFTRIPLRDLFAATVRASQEKLVLIVHPTAVRAH